MNNKQQSLIILISLFAILLGTTLFVSFSSNTTTQEVLIKSMTPFYDETSTIEVDNNNIVFNDKNQAVKYNVVLENTQDYDVKISDIKLSTPTEEFLSYKVEGISTDDIVEANSIKELTISFETMGIKGWGRNFADELTANISFEKIAKQEEVVPPVEEDKEEENQPEAPSTNIEEIINKAEKIETNLINNNTIEIKDGFKVEDGTKVETWIYPETEFYGYKEADESNYIKEIVLEKDKLDELKITPGEHNIVLSTEEKEVLGYVDVYIDENNELSTEKTQDKTDKEDSIVNKPSEDLEEEPKEDETGKVENPYTSTNGLVVVFGVATFITGIAIMSLCNKKVAKYTVFILMLSPAFTITNAEEVIELYIKNSVSFESQNVMKSSGLEWDDYSNEIIYDSDNEGYWTYALQIKNIYINNEINEILEYEYEFDVTEKGNGKVMAYLVTNKDDSNYYDLYLQADGIIYPNSNASFYFGGMKYLDKIDNLDGIDTSNVTNMRAMFFAAGFYSEVFELDVSDLNTSKVTNMEGMFNAAGYNSKIFKLNVSNFDTSKVTNMKTMFSYTGYASPDFTLDVSNFDTSNVTDMSFMFNLAGYNNDNFELDVSNFDTTNVTNMTAMFQSTGYSSTKFTLDVSNFDTSNVTNMRYMFYMTGYNSEKFILDVSAFNTAKVTDMKAMFYKSGYSNTNFTLDVSNFDTSNVTDMGNMFSGTGYNSSKLNTSITIKNPNTISYNSMFSNVATKEGSQIKVNYTSETEELVNKMIATKSSNSNVVKGELVKIITDEISVGDEIKISDEKFNVISQTDDTITMLAQYNLGIDYKQNLTQNGVSFSNSSGWDYASVPKEIDIQTWSTNPKIYVNEYVEYIKIELGDNSVTGDLITLSELNGLGCLIPTDYAKGDVTEPYYNCNNSNYSKWISNDQYWWTRSSVSTSSDNVWYMSASGNMGYYFYYRNLCGIRPTITISKNALNKLNS